MNRGSAGAGSANLAPDIASMRPRFMNRGSARPDRQRGAGQAASMRPRFMNRGSSPCGGSVWKISDCFNEAPIHESGK